jgi:hypothetical protein
MEFYGDEYYFFLSFVLDFSDEGPSQGHGAWSATAFEEHLDSNQQLLKIESFRGMLTVCLHQQIETIGRRDGVAYVRCRDCGHVMEEEDLHPGPPRRAHGREWKEEKQTQRH